MTGVPQVVWQTIPERDPSGPVVASGSVRGRFSLASKSHVQSVDARPRPQAEQEKQTARATATLLTVPGMR
jgi:hypothetical protein